MQNSMLMPKALLTSLTLVLACCGLRAEAAEERFEGWDLEPGVARAHLVMVARVTSISKVTVVEGAKTDLSLREYRFQPVKMLKGIFARDELSMTASDLGLPAEQTSSDAQLKDGEFRLLILAQQGGFSSFGGLPVYGCVSAAPGATTFAQRVPLLTGPDDPLVAVVETLISVVDSRSRREQARLLIDRLIEAQGVAAVPLLTSLRSRADLAADDERAGNVLARLAGSAQPAVREAALAVLSGVLLAPTSPGKPKQLDALAETLRAIIESDEAKTSIRVAALEALGQLLELDEDAQWSHELLTSQLSRAATDAERAASAVALSEIQKSTVLEPLLGAFASLPLDEQSALEASYVRALVRLLPGELNRPLEGELPATERALIDRLQRSLAAGQSLAAEIEPLGHMHSSKSLPLLLAAVEAPQSSQIDRQKAAWALGQLGDDAGVPVLVDMLRGNNHQLKVVALTALEMIDSDAAAQAARPLLRTEAHLPYKLRIARLLARHGFADGYALATEHLVDHPAEATLVLVALDDPRTSEELETILASTPDRQWRAAALTGLAAIGNKSARKALLKILNDSRHPLAADAARAAGLAADSELLLPLAKLAESRNAQIAKASLYALRCFLTGVRLSPRGLAAVDMLESASPAVDIPTETHAALAEAVSALAADAFVPADLRSEALVVARLLGGDAYAELLAELADQAELTGTPLLATVQAERRRLSDLLRLQTKN